MECDGRALCLRYPRLGEIPKPEPAERTEEKENRKQLEPDKKLAAQSAARVEQCSDKIPTYLQASQGSAKVNSLHLYMHGACGASPVPLENKKIGSPLPPVPIPLSQGSYAPPRPVDAPTAYAFRPRRGRFLSPIPIFRPFETIRGRGEICAVPQKPPGQ